jgi:hypothetical protein
MLLDLQVTYDKSLVERLMISATQILTGDASNLTYSAMIMPTILVMLSALHHCKSRSKEALSRMMSSVSGFLRAL